jgi:AraC-like DNA-binding protein
LITDWVCPPLEAVSRRHTEFDPGDRVVIFTAKAGVQRFILGDSEIRLEPGNTVVLSARTTPKLRLSMTGQMRKRTIAFPAVSLEACGSDGPVPESLMLDESRPLVKLFRDYVDAIWPRLGEMNAAEIEVTRSSLLHLIAGAMRPEPLMLGDPALLPALRLQLEQWILENLTERVLVEDIAHANNVSTRTVHRAFALTGDTVGSVIRTHRLTNARRDLVTTQLPIGAIAHKWGYYDASHFGREFRRAFSASPGEYRDEFALHHQPHAHAVLGLLPTAG